MTPFTKYTGFITPFSKNKSFMTPFTKYKGFLDTRLPTLLETIVWNY